MSKFKKLFILLFIAFSPVYIYSQSGTPGVNLDTVKAHKFDGGKMWTFDFPPLDYFQEAYGFKPTQAWMDKVRMSALRFADYCSASFVSEDGLVMTNHHCGRESVSLVQKEGEDLHENGFIAAKLEDERKVDRLYVDQLVKIIDVTKEIQSAIDRGKDPDEKDDFKYQKITEIEKKNSEGKTTVCQVVSLYNGGVYSAYIYKRYNDVRLVFAPEDQAGFFGGDPDNFTYPRYNLDCTFFRVYDENGKPLKVDNFFKWSSNGAEPGEPIFVVGNPGSTSRLLTMSQLEYNRDISYPLILNYINGLVDSIRTLIARNPDKEKELNNQLFEFTNSQKVYKGTVKGLNDLVLMARKKDFEKKFRAAVDANPKLKAKYGNVWNDIAKIVIDKREAYDKMKGGSFRALYSKLNEIGKKEEYYNQILGRAIFEVYGTSIPPDATFTLRISDGIIKQYDYNGTTAPAKTTFFGALDRYFSFNKQYPWSLPNRWLNLPKEFDLSTPFNFISTNDIIGGNSGSPMINKNAEIVGLVFDGNIESMPGEFIYTDEVPTTVSVDSRGLLECINNLYLLKRLGAELQNGKITE
ncbi:MAG: S46 family peptidase [Ignavibacteria bacterium]|nr:S46 family peptidase [Ignavibacteria bacterium]